MPMFNLKKTAFIALCIAFNLHSMNQKPPAQQTAAAAAAAAAAATAQSATAGSPQGHGARVNLFIGGGKQIIYGGQNVRNSAAATPQHKAPQQNLTQTPQLSMKEQYDLDQFKKRFRSVPEDTRAARRHLYYLKIDIASATQAPAVTPGKVLFQKELSKLLNNVQTNYAAILYTLNADAYKANLDNARSDLLPKVDLTLEDIASKQTKLDLEAQNPNLTKKQKLLIAKEKNKLLEKTQQLLAQRAVLLGAAPERITTVHLIKPDTLQGLTYPASGRFIPGKELKSPALGGGRVISPAKKETVEALGAPAASASSSSSRTAFPAQTLQFSVESRAPNTAMLSTRSERRAAERAALNAVAAAASASSSAHATSAGSSSSAASAAGHTFNFQPAKVATGHTKESDRRKQPTPSASTSSAPATTPGATH